MSNWTDRSIDTALNIFDYAQNLVDPSIKLGVTGLSRSGKTVFITSLVYHLLARSNLRFFEPLASGRIDRIYLEPHPDDLLPRFDYEGNLACLTGTPPRWPEGTRQISQLRLTIEYQSDQFLARTLGTSKLHLDIIDYPGEWLLDLPLLEKSYEDWSAEALLYAEKDHTTPHAENWQTALAAIDPGAPADEALAKTLADHFTDFLTAARAASPDLPTIPPGRFLMPGDMKGSPALTFAPLALNGTQIEEGSMAALMQRRFEAYKTHIVRPFYRKFFTRLDRQIVLVDVLSNLNAGPDHVHHLQNTLSEILKSFNPGAQHWLTSIFNKKIDRLVFAATKADHLHHHNHDQLQNLLTHLTHSAIQNAELEGADVKVQALASLRTTQEVEVTHNNETYEALQGIPANGTVFDGRTFDGKEEILLFPGDLPDDIDRALQSPETLPDIEILNFNPPVTDADHPAIMPHIRLDRALNMLIGDKLR